MAKQAGMGDNLYVAGYDLSGDIGSLGSIRGGSDVQDVTGIDKSGKERLGLVRDGQMEFMSFFNPAVDRAHDRFENLPLTDQLCLYARGTLQGSHCANLVAKQLNYDGSRAENGALTFKIDMVANGFGLDWGQLLTAGKRTDSAPTSPATGLDLVDVTTAFGWQAFLHVFAFTGTNVTMTIQDSADNSAFANLAGAAFTAATGITSERLEGGRTATVRRFIRVITTGTFSNAVFAVGFTRNLTSVLF